MPCTNLCLHDISCYAASFEEYANSVSLPSAYGHLGFRMWSAEECPYLDLK